jgi:hypothetical protein
MKSDVRAPSPALGEETVSKGRDTVAWRNREV